jgi:branched-chain amino acid transport system substrate-binding protein
MRRFLQLLKKAMAKRVKVRIIWRTRARAPDRRTVIEILQSKGGVMKLRMIWAGVVLSLMSTVAPASADITIGAIFSLTGPNASLGIPFQRALKLGPTEINGEKVHYIVLDDASDPSVAVRNARKLVEEDKADVIVGPTGAPTAMALANVLHELRVPMVAGAPVDVFGDRAHWIFSVVPPADTWMGPVVTHMKANGAQSVGFIGFNDTWGDQNYNALKKASDRAGLKIVADERYARADNSVTPQTIKLIAARPSVVFIGASGSPGALPLLALADRGYKGQTYNSIAVFNQQFIQIGGKAVEGTIAATGPVGVAAQLPESNVSKPVAMEFIRRYEAENGQASTNTFAAFCYDSVLVIAAAATDAMKKAKPGTQDFRNALRDALRTHKEIVGTNGVFNFKEGTPYGLDERSTVLVRVDGGKWTLVK